jgi:hypothetical protein
MQHYLDIATAVDATVDGEDPEHFLRARGALRKFASLAVVCMEQNGAVPRFQNTLTPSEYLRPTERARVYELIDEERAYQEGGSGGHFSTPRRAHEFSELLTMLRKYMRQAEDNWVEGPGVLTILDGIRKLAAIAVRTMELHGAPARS